MSDGELGEELVRLASADNFRDVTGPDAAYVAADGRPLRRGVAFRSNELQLTTADAESLARLGITAIYDLRSDHEVETHPDVDVPGATWTTSRSRASRWTRSPTSTTGQRPTT